MKVVVASTDEQLEKLNELIQHVYSSVFPCYFTNQEIQEYIQLDILQFPKEKDSKLYTLDVAFRAITSLEVIINILENPLSCEHEHLFDKNVKILEESGLSFPFTYSNFLKKYDSECILFAKPANQYLV